MAIQVINDGGQDASALRASCHRAGKGQSENREDTILLDNHSLPEKRDRGCFAEQDASLSICLWARAAMLRLSVNLAVNRTCVRSYSGYITGYITEAGCEQFIAEACAQKLSKAP